MVHTVLEPDPGQEFGGPLGGPTAVQPSQSHRRHHVAARRQRGNEVERLKDNAHSVTAVSGQRFALESDHLLAVDLDASGRGREDPRKAGKQRGLAAAARSEQDHQFAVVRFEAEAVKGPDEIAAGVVLDAELSNVKISHQAPAKAAAGSTPTARRRATRLESSPTITAASGR